MEEKDREQEERPQECCNRKKAVKVLRDWVIKPFVMGLSFGVGHWVALNFSQKFLKRYTQHA